VVTLDFDVTEEGDDRCLMVGLDEEIVCPSEASTAVTVGPRVFIFSMADKDRYPSFVVDAEGITTFENNMRDDDCDDTIMTISMSSYQSYSSRGDLVLRLEGKRRATSFVS